MACSTIGNLEPFEVFGCVAMSGYELSETGSDGSVEIFEPLGGFERGTENLGILEE
jgi:hypothetical protein